MTPEGSGRSDDAAEPKRRKRRRRRPRSAADETRGAAERGAAGAAARATRSSTGSSRAAAGSTEGKEASGASKRGSGRRRRKATAARTPPKPAAQRATKTVKEVSAGGVVYRRHEGRTEVILASRRTRRGDLAWGLAKGGIEPDESMEEAAVREVREETGIRGEIEASLGDTRYVYVWEGVRIRKTVHFFLMREAGGDVADRDDEMEEVRWFPLDRALKRAAYRGERDVLRRAADVLR